ncbi:hypothetical protein C8Q80DRAFT_348891 [Daedaleopsis nitida]|nr:hypothetical protein C8Q80DRAFT_348891 [Daedaleopsis nitida]
MLPTVFTFAGVDSGVPLLVLPLAEYIDLCSQAAGQPHASSAHTAPGETTSSSLGFMQHAGNQASHCTHVGASVSPRRLRKRSCKHCHDARKACKGARPCLRCTDLGLQCVEYISQRPGRKPRKTVKPSQRNGVFTPGDSDYTRVNSVTNIGAVVQEQLEVSQTLQQEAATASTSSSATMTAESGPGITSAW